MLEPVKTILVVKDNASPQLCRVSEASFRLHTRFRLADEAREYRQYLGELFGWVPETTYICSICGNEKDRAMGYYGPSNTCVNCYVANGKRYPNRWIDPFKD